VQRTDYYWNSWSTHSLHIHKPQSFARTRITYTCDSPFAQPTKTQEISVDMSFLRSSASVTFCVLSSLLRRCSAPVLSDVKYLQVFGCVSIYCCVCAWEICTLKSSVFDTRRKAACHPAVSCLEPAPVDTCGTCSESAWMRFT